MGIGGAWFEDEHRAFGSTSGRGFGQRLDWLGGGGRGRRASLLDGDEATSPAGGRYAFDHLRVCPRRSRRTCR